MKIRTCREKITLSQIATGRDGKSSDQTAISKFDVFQSGIMEILKLSKDFSDFYFRGDNYITKKVKVVSLVRDTTTDPSLHPYQILWNYLKQYRSYGLHKISASREITT